MHRQILTGLASALAAGGVLAAPAADAAVPRHGVFAISLHGVQRYEHVTTRTARPEFHSFDERGTTESRSEVAFRTPRPTRALVVRDGEHLRIRYLTHQQDGLPVVAEVRHSGSSAMERADGFLTTPAGVETRWAPIPPPATSNCTATVEHPGFQLFLERGRAEAEGSSSLMTTKGDQFLGCPYGDHSGDLYTASGPASVRAIMRDPETELVLHGDDQDRRTSAYRTSDVRRTTTVHVLLRKAV